MKRLVDTILYNPSIEVTNIDKEAGKVTVIDLFNGNKERTLKLHQSKQDGCQYYFKMNRCSYWLDLLYQKEEG